MSFFSSSSVPPAARAFFGKGGVGGRGAPSSARPGAAAACASRAPSLRAAAGAAAALGLAAYLAAYLNSHCGPPPPAEACPAWLDGRYPPLAPDAAAAAWAAAAAAASPPFASAASATSASASAALSPAAAAAVPGARAPLPAPAPAHVDLVVIVPTAAAWVGRRAAFRRAWARTLARLPPGRSAALLFVLGSRAGPGGEGGPPRAPPPDADDADVVAVDCADLDGSGGWATPEADSATSCKVLAGAAAAVARFPSFYFLARVGDDAYFRADAFLARVAPAHLPGSPAPHLALGYWMGEHDIGLPGHTHALGGPEADARGAPAFRLSRAPPYLGGLGYVLSYNVTLAIVELAARVGAVDAYAEDVMTGLWLAGFAHAPPPRAPADAPAPGPGGAPPPPQRAAPGRGLTRVHTPCFHNHAEPVPAPARPAGWARLWLAAPCTPSSLLVHYMTDALWARAAADAGGDGAIECGGPPRAGWCDAPPWRWLAPATA